MSRGLFTILLLVALAMATATAGDGAATQSGVYGLVERGPISPFCSAEQPCSEPDAGARVTFTRNGISFTVSTSKTGAYRLPLAPGVYTISTRGRRVEPAMTKVKPSRFTRVDLSIDTGVR